MKQLRFSRPARVATMDRMTDRQQRLLGFLRWEGGKPVPVDRLGDILGYSYPRRACDRLVARGLVRKIEPGVYASRPLRERKA